MLNSKKLLSMLLALTMILGFSALQSSAASFIDPYDVPDDLPVGTIKIAEGIYKYTPDENSADLYNSSTDWVDIGPVPAYGQIVQPANLRNIVVDPGHRYIMLQASENIRINFVRGTQSVFGANYGSWPKINDAVSHYYIEAAYYNIEIGKAYQMQCTSASMAWDNVRVRFFTAVNPGPFID